MIAGCAGGPAQHRHLGQRKTGQPGTAGLEECLLGRKVGGSRLRPGLALAAVKQVLLLLGKDMGDKVLPRQAARNAVHLAQVGADPQNHG